MTDQLVPTAAVPDEEDYAPPRSPWELPEIVALAVLVAFALLVVSGLVTAIVTGTAPDEPPSPGNQLIGLSLGGFKQCAQEARRASPMVS
jgi:hypothetical protein